MKLKVKFDFIQNIEKQMEAEQEKVFKSNLEEAMDCDYVLMLRNAIDDFLKKKLEKAIMDAITEEDL